MRELFENNLTKNEIMNLGERSGSGVPAARRAGIWSVLIVIVISASMGINFLLYGQEDNPVKSARKRKVTLRYVSGRLKERYTVIEFQNGDRELDGRYTFWYFNGQVAVNCYYDHYDLTVDSTSYAELAMQATRNEGRNGLWQSWYKDGKKRGEHYYKNGKLDGQFIKWWPDGRKSQECTYENGSKEGLENHWNEDGLKTYECTYKSGIKDGVEVHWFDNGKKSSECFFVNGSKEGFETTWNENGGKTYECSYKNDRKNGFETHWSDDGCIVYECCYRNGKRDGVETQWYNNGYKSYECTIANGEKNGSETRWEKNGYKSYECNYKKGVKDGMEIHWEDSAVKWYETNFINGREDGFKTYWYKDGEIWSDYTYLDGTEAWDEDGWSENGTAYYYSDTSGDVVPFKEFYLNGKKLQEGFLRNGKRTGKYTDYYNNGRIRRQNSYRNGKKEGKLTRWYENGRKYLQCYYIDGEKNGLQTQWYENGQKQRESEFANGYKHGRCTEWDQNGLKHIESQFYYDTQLKKTEWDKNGRVLKEETVSDKSHYIRPDLINNTAKFTTDYYPAKKGREKMPYDKWFWLIDGEKLTWGSDTVRIEPTLSGVHTIVWYESQKATPDTTYLHISEPNTYVFYFNPCCGNYNINRIYIGPEKSGEAVELTVKGKLDREPMSFSVVTTGATYECVGKVLSNSRLTVPFPKFTNRSAMASNLTGVEVSILSYCRGKECSGDKVQSIYFGYVVLDDNPVSVIYDTELKKLYLE